MKKLLRSLLRRDSEVINSASIVVVSGLPRSGTSMMMKTLEAGGLVAMTDSIRTADDDNPKGYYEFERVKQLDKGDTAWLPEAQGKVVKVISALLKHLPGDYQYKVIFMHRHLDEILASQKKMLLNRGEDPNKASDDELRKLFEKHKASVISWLHTQPNIELLDIDYGDFLQDASGPIEQINVFLDNWLHAERMAEVVDPTLYRNRVNAQYYTRHYKD